MLILNDLEHYKYKYVFRVDHIDGMAPWIVVQDAKNGDKATTSYIRRSNKGDNVSKGRRRHANL